MTCMGPCRGLPRARVQPQMSREVATFAFACVLMRVWSHATDQLTGTVTPSWARHIMNLQGPARVRVWLLPA